jgi:hypothetical protein
MTSQPDILSPEFVDDPYLDFNPVRLASIRAASQNCE